MLSRELNIKHILKQQILFIFFGYKSRGVYILENTPTPQGGISADDIWGKI
jgi:hypothetical protein